MATAVLFLVAFVVLTFAGGGATLFRWGRFRIGAARRLP